jgi:hypothetical protein
MVSPQTPTAISPQRTTNDQSSDVGTASSAESVFAALSLAATGVLAGSGFPILVALTTSSKLPG